MASGPPGVSGEPVASRVVEVKPGDSGSVILLYHVTKVVPVWGPAKTHTPVTHTLVKVGTQLWGGLWGVMVVVVEL